MTPSSVVSQLAALGIRPRKGLGQNFLVDPAHRARIVGAAQLTSGDTVLEVGPGPGVLTDLLAAQAGRVIAVELDDRLIPFLRQRYADQPHVTIVHADILEVDVDALLQEATGLQQPASSIQHPVPSIRYKVVANLPYYVTSAAIRHLLEAPAPPDLLVLTVQREVAERMVARPPHMSLLALGVQYYCSGEIVARVPAGAFFPVPKVDSAVVRLARRPAPIATDITVSGFFRVARAGFGQPRKQLRNSLAAGLGLTTAQVEAWLTGSGVAPARRAETITLEEWAVLARSLDT